MNEANVDMSVVDDEPLLKDKVLGYLATLVAIIWIKHSVFTIFPDVIAIFSPITGTLPKRTYGRLFIASFIGLGALGLFFRRSWGRKLLLVFLSFKALIWSTALLRVLGGAQWSPFGILYFGGIAAFYLASYAVTLFGASLTPSPPVPASNKRKAAAAALIGLPVLFMSLTTLIPPLSLEEVPQSANRELDGLRRAKEWEGDRIAFDRMEGKTALRKKVGDWKIRIVPEGADILRLEGFDFAEKIAVKIDTSRNALIIHDTVFVGKAAQGVSPVFDNLEFEGVTFSSDSGRIFGDASVLFLSDGRVAFSFDRVFIDGRRIAEYGTLRPVK